MRTLAVLVALVAPAVAHADRNTVVDVGVTMGGAGTTTSNSDSGGRESFALIGPRVTLGWENHLVDVPDAPGYNFAGALVPELVLGSYIQSDRAEGYVGVGLRADLQMGQRDQGLLKVSARGAIYVVGRALVVGARQEPMYEFGFGEYLTRFHSRTRIGFEFTVVDRPDDLGDNTNSVGGFLALYVGGGAGN
jgi:hypothetical protein